MSEDRIELERGELRCWARPRVELASIRTYADVQRFAVTLSKPRSARLVAIGRKRMPAVRERAWAYVERIAPSVEEVVAPLAASSYMTKTRGLRHQAGAIEVARGTYAIVGHGTHVHLDLMIDAAQREDLLAPLRIAPRASYIAAVFNPEAKWRPDDGAPFREPSIYDDEEMDRFEGRRFAPLAPDLIDVEGAELVLVGGPVLAPVLVDDRDRDDDERGEPDEIDVLMRLPRDRREPEEEPIHRHEPERDREEHEQAIARLLPEPEEERGGDEEREHRRAGEERMQRAHERASQTRP
jgi:hypothetical protein